MEQVFISYAWGKNNEEDKKIKKFTDYLAYFLSRWDIKVHLDVYENYPGSDLDMFMSDGIDQSKFVICICTESYFEKMKDPKSGVFNEITLLSEYARDKKIIPIIEKGADLDFPDFFKGKFYQEFNFDQPYSLENKQSFISIIKTLIKCLFSTNNINTRERLKEYDVYSNDLILEDKICELMKFDSHLNDTVTIKYNIYREFQIGKEPMTFITGWSDCGIDAIYAYKYVKTFYSKKNFKEFDLIQHPRDLKNIEKTPIGWSCQLNEGDGMIWINEKGYIALGKIIKIQIHDENNELNEVTFSYKILDPIDCSLDLIDCN